MKPLIYTYFVLFLFTSVCLAQSRTVQKNNMQWVQYYTTTHLNDDWYLQIDGGYRLQNNFEDKVGYILRSAVAYQKTNKLSLAAGLGYLGNYSNDIFSRHEIRPHQEINYNTYWKQLKVSHRARIEERFLLNQNNANSFNVRFRYGLLFNYKLWNWNDDKNGLDLIFGNELFLQAFNEKINTTFQQNRIMVSPTFVFDNFSLGFTFTNQFTAISNGNYRKNNLIWLQIRHHFYR